MLRQRSIFAEAAVTDDGDGVKLVEGKVLHYGGPANKNGWVHAPGAAAASVATLPREGVPHPMLYEHEFAIGRWLELLDSISGVRGKGRTSKTDRAEEVVILLEDKAINGISSGFWPNWDETYVLAPGEKIELNTPYGPWAYEAKDWEVVFGEEQLLESSIVAVPAESDNRVSQKVLQKAATAMPGLRQGAEWEELAYSMALIMGGRGAGQAFEDVDEHERLAMYAKLCQGYRALEKEPPVYDPRPQYEKVAFRHDERQVFADRYLRKSLASVVAGAGGYEGPLSPATREQAELAKDQLDELLERKGVTDELGALSQRLAGLASDLKGAN